MTLRTFLLMLAAWGSLSPDALAQRLPTGVSPEHYDLTFTLDLAKARFAGKTGIDVRLSQATTEVRLNALELDITAASISAGGQTQKAQVALNADTQTATLTVARPIAAGRARIDVEYQAALNQQLRGFYLSKGRNRTYAVTQFEATDARRAFPVLRRAGVQGDVRDHGDDRPRRHRDLQRQGAVGHAGPAPDAAHDDVRHDAEDVVVSGGDGRRRLRVPRGRRRRHADPRLRHAGQAGARPASRSSPPSRSSRSQRLLRHQVSVRQARHRRRAGLRRRRDGEHRAPSSTARPICSPTSQRRRSTRARRSRRSWRTRWRTSGSAIW